MMFKPSELTPLGALKLAEILTEAGAPAGLFNVVETQMGPLVSLAQREKVLAFIETGRREGARLVTGGGIPAGDAFTRGAFVEPTIFDGVTDDMTIAREEIFGPVLSLLTFDGEDEAVARANATPYGLAAGVFTRDVARAHRVAGALQAGICWVNTYNVTPVEVPFGGVKLSGLGRENGRAALDGWSQVKTVLVAGGPVQSPY